MEWLKNILADAKALISAPLSNILCVAGVVLVGISFADYDKVNGLSLHGQVYILPAISGFALILFGVILFYATNKTMTQRLKLDYDKGVEIKRGELKILIKASEIQKIENATRNSAIVLPANTTFIDDCATDKRTAMGAFFSEKFPEEIGNLPALFKEVLISSKVRSIGEGQYKPGTTIILPDRFAKPAKVIVTASTIRLSGAGIASNPNIICHCVEEILKVTADQRVDTIYMPILGSGHGGVERGLSLLFLLLSVLHYSKLYHHIKHVQVIVHPKDVPILNVSKELRQIVAL